MRAKLHRIKVKEKKLDYEGSVEVSADILRKVGMLPYEHVEIYDLTNGNRWTSYLIPSEKKNYLSINGAGCRLVEVNDELIIVSFAYLDPAETADFRPVVAYFDENNGVVAVEKKPRLGGIEPPTSGSGDRRSIR